VFLVLSLAFLAYPIAMVLGHPHWSAVGTDLVVPHMHSSSGFILLGVALIGTTVSPYMQFYAAAGVVDRRGSQPPMRHLRADAIAGAVFACVVSITIIVATGTVIGGHGPLQSAAQAALALRPAAGSGAETLFAIGLIGASALAAAVVPLSTSYAVGETIGVARSVSARFSQAPLFLGLFTAQIALGALVAMTPINVISLLIGSQVLQGLISPIVLIYILVLANRRSLLGAAANSSWYRILAGAVVAGIAGMSTLLLVTTVAGW
jgi:Mn2+/Fe2+ NRAMP family transporter